MKGKEKQVLRCPVCHKGRIIDAASGTDPSCLNLWTQAVRQGPVVCQMPQVWGADRHHIPEKLNTEQQWTAGGITACCPSLT